MKIIRVQYTVQPQYVERNKENIKKVMEDVRAIGNPDFKYATYQLEDGNSFIHFSMAATEEASQLLSKVESFGKFRQELKASEPISPPKSENLSLVAAGFDLF